MANNDSNMTHYTRWNDPLWQAKRLERKEKKKHKKEEKLYDDWIWVEGYKATDKNMVCRDKQYRFGTVFEMPENEKVIDCQSGFHLCLKLGDVFKYYNIGHENRFFKVRALVRKCDVAEYDSKKNPYAPGTMEASMWAINYSLGIVSGGRDKLAAKAIEFISELTVDEVFESTDMKDWSHEDKVLVMKYSKQFALDHRKVDKLVSAGYSYAFADYMAHNLKDDTINLALAVASQPDLSMDVKVLTIMKGLK